MYSVKDALKDQQNLRPDDVWNDRIVCLYDNKEKAMLFSGGRVMERLSVFSYTIVQKGTLVFSYNGSRLEMQENDLLVYTPGMEINVVDASDDFEGICLAIDEHLALEMPVLRNMVRTAFFPVIEQTQPKLILTQEQREMLSSQFELIRYHINTPSAWQEQSLLFLCSAYLLDVADIQQKSLAKHRFSEHTEEVFLNFISLASDHFKEHHDIGFYADRMNITTTYLSRIVKEISGKTVIDHLSRLLVMEASYLLKYSDKTITQIADELHFADGPTFTKFFKRVKGVGPREFRSLQ